MNKDFITGGQGRFISSLAPKDSSITSGKPTGLVQDLQLKDLLKLYLMQTILKENHLI